MKWQRTDQHSFGKRQTTMLFEWGQEQSAIWQHLPGGLGLAIFHIISLRLTWIGLVMPIYVHTYVNRSELLLFSLLGGIFSTVSRLALLMKRTELMTLAKRHWPKKMANDAISAKLCKC